MDGDLVRDNPWFPRMCPYATGKYDHSAIKLVLKMKAHFVDDGLTDNLTAIVKKYVPKE